MDDDIPDLIPASAAAATTTPSTSSTVAPPPPPPSSSSSFDSVLQQFEARKRVPVTILTGFLGSGKTTLLNYILTEDHGYRIAVIQNEFGESLGVENEMVVKKETSTLLHVEELSNGCVCCTMLDSLVLTLERLMQKSEKFDYILLETTGLANPGPLVSNFWLDDNLGGSLFLDGIITVVDAHNLEKSLNRKSQANEENPSAKETPNETVRQLAFADCVLLNKIDLESEEKLHELEKTIRGINSVAPIYRTHRSRLPLGKVLNLKAFDKKNLEVFKEEEDEDDARLEICIGGETCSHNDHHHHHRQKEEEKEKESSAAAAAAHTANVSTVVIQMETAMDLARLEKWLAKILWEGEMAENIYRFKGMLNVAGSNQIHILQGVHELFDVQIGREWQEGEPKVTKFVFIGCNLDRKFLEDGFAANCAKVE